MKTLRIAAAQIEADYFNKKKNQQKVLSLVQSALEKHVELILFPEGINLGYFIMDQSRSVSEKSALAHKMADTLTSEWVEELKKMALRGIHVGCGLFLRTERGELFNTLLLITPEGKIHAYNKTHLFHVKDIKEQDFISKGDELPVIKMDSFNVGLSICYDLNFPEVFRSLALKGAEIILLSAAWPKIAGRVWDLLLPARAVENQVYMVACNQTGNEYYGHSKIIDYTGKIVAELTDEEDVITAEIDIDKLRKWKSIVTYFYDRRPEIYKI
jgi:predicted amidohydrolase